MLCIASTISDICAANSLHLISLAGRDYTPVTTNLTLNNTNAAIPQTVTIPILDDLFLEGSEVFNMTLTTNNYNAMLLPNTIIVIIEDVEGKLKRRDYHTASYPVSFPFLKEPGKRPFLFFLAFLPLSYIL